MSKIAEKSAFFGVLMIYQPICQPGTKLNLVNMTKNGCFTENPDGIGLANPRRLILAIFSTIFDHFHVYLPCEMSQKKIFTIFLLFYIFFMYRKHIVCAYIILHVFDLKFNFCRFFMVSDHCALFGISSTTSDRFRPGE